MFIPRIASAIRIQQPSKSSSEEASPNMLSVHIVLPQESHENGFRLLMKARRITPSCPNHMGYTAPIFTRHLLRNVDAISFQHSCPIPGGGHG
ncbi:hypothetical protein DITRI_Ditri19aG0054000 [Diplodiscus trichospermus]